MACLVRVPTENVKQKMQVAPTLPSISLPLSAPAFISLIVGTNPKLGQNSLIPITDTHTSVKYLMPSTASIPDAQHCVNT